jgi:hypothetical protein
LTFRYDRRKFACDKELINICHQHLSKNTMKRRTFIRNTAMTATSLAFLPKDVFAAADTKVKIGLIGTWPAWTKPSRIAFKKG